MYICTFRISTYVRVLYAVFCVQKIMHIVLCVHAALGQIGRQGLSVDITKAIHSELNQRKPYDTHRNNTHRSIICIELHTVCVMFTLDWCCCWAHHNKKRTHVHRTYMQLMAIY